MNETLDRTVETIKEYRNRKDHSTDNYSRTIFHRESLLIYPVITIEQVRTLIRCQETLEKIISNLEKVKLHIIINDKNKGINTLFKIMSAAIVHEPKHLIEIAENISTLLGSSGLSEKEHALYELSYYKEIYGELVILELIKICKDTGIQTIPREETDKLFRKIFMDILNKKTTITLISEYTICRDKSKLVDILNCTVNLLSKTYATMLLLPQELLFLKKLIPGKSIIIQC